MKKILLTAALMTLSTQIWANGLIECRFDSPIIYKLTILLNAGSNGLTIQFEDSDKPSLTYIHGRDEEEVNFNKVRNTDQFILQAQDYASHSPSYTAILSPVKDRRSTLELFITQYGKTQYFEGRCFVIADLGN